MKKLLAACLAVSLCGCAWTTIDVQVTHPDGKTMKAHYFSSRDSELSYTTNGFTASGKASIVIDAQAKAMGYIVGEAAKGAAAGAVKP